MKKVQVKKNVKIVLIIINVILISIVSLSLYNTITNPGTKDEKISLYKYTAKPAVNYKVYLEPNILYDNEYLDEDNIYITEFIDRIEAIFSYQVSGDKQANISSNYKISANVEGYIEQGEEERIIWRKEFELLPEETFVLTDNNMLLEKIVSFKLDEYQSFVQEVVNASKTMTKTRLTVFMDVNLHGVTDVGTIEEKASPTLIIPLGKDYFDITKEKIEEIYESIDTTNIVELPVDKKLVNSYIALLVIGIIALVFLIFFVVGIKEQDIFIVTLNKIFKKYGNRFVAMDSYKEANYKNYTHVKTMDDLIRVADEIQRPVMYKYNDNAKKITRFYTFDEAWMYVFDLECYINELNISANDKEEELVSNVKDS